MRLRLLTTWGMGLTLALSAYQNLSANTSANPNKTRSRLEELFVWRVSDGLELTPDQESKFSTEFKRLNEKKAQLSEDIESLVATMEQALETKKVEQQLADYKRKLSEQNQIQVEEFDSFQKLFGKQKFAKYLVLKRELTQKLKDFVSSPTKIPQSSSKKLREPKIIQDESH